MHLLDLSPACVRISLRTNITCFDEVAQPGAAALALGLCSQLAPPGHTRSSRR